MTFIRDYCLSKFKDSGRVVSDGRELTIPSMFIPDDWKRHQSINLETGLWRCFKTGETGNFLKLYSILEKCSYREAYERFIYEDFMGNDRFGKREAIKSIDPDQIVSNLEEATNFKVVEDHPLVVSRMLGNFKFYIAKDGMYKGRLIIPFINSKGRMFYFQGRALNGEFPKYLNCKDLKSSQVLYPFDYGSYDPLYVTEGVFDCLTLQSVGLNATTTLSCFTSREQMMQLSQYQGPLVCAFDSDKAGMDGKEKFMKLAHWARRDDIYMASPTSKCKDWNELIIKKGPDEVIRACEHKTKLNSLNLQYLKFTSR